MKFTSGFIIFILKYTLLLVPIAIVISGCARGYHPVNPSLFQYDNMQNASDSVIISYRYKPHELVNNKPYARKERGSNYKLIALQVENNSSTPITLNTDNLTITTSSGDTIYNILNENYLEKIRQSEELFLIFYGAAGLGASFSKGSDSGIDFDLSYNPIPLAVGALNALYAGSSNRKHKRDLSDEFILYKRIAPNSRLHGLLVIYADGYPELKFHFSR